MIVLRVCEKLNTQCRSRDRERRMAFRFSFSGDESLVFGI
jgi:hypothetical protein